MREFRPGVQTWIPDMEPGCLMSGIWTWSLGISGPDLMTWGPDPGSRTGARTWESWSLELGPGVLYLQPRVWTWNLESGPGALTWSPDLESRPGVKTWTWSSLVSGPRVWGPNLQSGGCTWSQELEHGSGVSTGNSDLKSAPGGWS